MLSKLLTKIIIWALKTTKITGEDKARITTALLNNIDALPIRDAISFDADGTILIRGKKLELEQIQNLKTGASVLKDNFARKLIEEQLLYECSKIGLHQGVNTEQIVFSKACVWCLQQMDRFIDILDS